MKCSEFPKYFTGRITSTMRRLATLSAVLVIMDVLFINAQTFQITGKVTSSEDSTALPGVSVVAKGTTIGTITDTEGNYVLAVPVDASTLVFSFLGMVSLEVAIADTISIDVVLETDVLGIEKVFVTAIGITRTEKSLGYSVQSVESREISLANTSDLINSISGRTAGVQITSSSGMPGSSTFITIRGAASIIGDNQPLFVIDGMPIVTGRGETATVNRLPYTTGGTGSSSRSIDLNPEDIASMTILKGGAATALYGVRAANGVIVITTKKGTQSGNRVNVDFHTSIGFDRVSQLPPLQRKFVQGEDGEWKSGSWVSWGPNADTLQYDTTTDPNYKWDKNGEIVGQSDIAANGIPVKMYDQYEFFQTGITFNNRLSISSENDQTTYYFSIADIEQSGIVPSSSFGRTNVRLNASSKITKWFKVSTNMTYSNSRANQLNQGSNASGVMLGLLRTPPSFDNAQGYEFPDGSQRNYRHGTGYDNPYWTVNKNYLDDRIKRFIGNAILNFTFTDWFSASYNIGLDTYTRQRKNVIAKGSRYFPPGTLEEGIFVSSQLNSDLLLNFSQIFGEFKAVLILGNNLFSTGWKELFGDADGLEIPYFYNLTNSSDNQTGLDMEEYRTAALFFDLQLAYSDILFLGITGRNDWSTTMPEKNRSAFYPSINLGFVFTEIPGIKGNDILSFGKLRGSLARSANIATPYRTKNYYFRSITGDGWTEGVGFPWMGTTGFDVNNTLGNQDLWHEFMTSFEVGTDLRFFLNRFGIDFAYFQNANSDLLLRVPIPSSFGYEAIYMNAASMESVGYELTLSAWILTGKLGWDVLVNWTKMTNNVISLAEGVESVALGGFTIPQTRAVAGREYGSIYGNDWYRDPVSNAVLINDDPDDALRDGYPMTDTRQMVPIGDVNPEWTANITNTFTYKDFRLSFMFDIKQGGWMYNGTGFAMNFFGVHERTVNREVYYTPEGTIDFDRTPEKNLVVFDGVNGHVDRGEPVSSGVTNDSPVVLDEDWFEGYGSNFGGGAQTASMEPTDWIRLREVTLSYIIPSRKKIISSAEVYFTGRNLWLRAPYSGIDPETNLQGAINGQGMDYFNMPGTKSYTIGMKLSF